MVSIDEVSSNTDVNKGSSENEERLIFKKLT